MDQLNSHLNWYQRNNMHLERKLLLEIASNAKHCGPTSLTKFLTNVTGKVGHELDEVLAFMDTMHGATPPLGKVHIGYHNILG